jgi:hypothetical protein
MENAGTNKLKTAKGGNLPQKPGNIREKEG